MSNREKALAWFVAREKEIPMKGAREMYQEAIEALRQVNEIRRIVMETTENFDTEDPVEAIKRIREVLHG